MEKMKIIKTIPLSKNIPHEYLTYFSLKDIKVGMIVSVPVRKKFHDALVVEVSDAEIEKSSIKNASFVMKKIDKIKGESFFEESFINSAVATSKFFATKTGAVLDIVIPEFILKNYEKISKLYKKIDSPNDGEKVVSKLAQEKIVFQASLEDRLSLYKTYIRESFAKKSSVYICLPTVHEIKYFAEFLEKGIEEYVFVMHSDLNTKDLNKNIEDMLKAKHPVLVIGTVPYLCLPCPLLKTVILERESATSYKQIGRPYIDLRSFVEILTYENKTKLIVGDTFLRPETTYRYEQGEFSDIPPFSFRVIPLPRDFILDMSRDTLGKEDKKWEILSDEAINAVRNIIDKNTQGLLFTLRKGLAPITSCGDCGKVHTCEFCSSPLSLYGGDSHGDRVFLCNKCKREQTSKALCKNCGSWNLVPLGIGTTGVRDYLKKKFPDLTVFVLDKDSVHSHKEATELVAEFYRTKKSVLIGTELALHYLTKKVHTAGIISLESLFSLPTFRINEKIIHIIESVRNIAEKSFFLQTKSPDSLLLTGYKSGTLLHVYRTELEERKQFLYPPFVRLIKISFKGSLGAVESAREFLMTHLAEYKPEFFDAFIKRVNNSYIEHALIKIPTDQWTVPGLSKSGTIDQKLLDLLRTLPPSYSVHIEPEELL